MDSTVRRGDIFYADLSPVVGSEQGGTRPVLIVQNDVCNMKSPNVIVVPITSKEKRWDWLHVELPTSTGIEKESYALCEQILTISKECLIKKIGELKDAELIRAVEQALQITLFFERGRKIK